MNTNTFVWHAWFIVPHTEETFCTTSFHEFGSYADARRDVIAKLIGKSEFPEIRKAPQGIVLHGFVIRNTE